MSAASPGNWVLVMVPSAPDACAPDAERVSLAPCAGWTGAELADAPDASVTFPDPCLPQPPTVTLKATMQEKAHALFTKRFSLVDQNSTTRIDVKVSLMAGRINASPETGIFYMTAGPDVPFGAATWGRVVCFTDPNGYKWICQCHINALAPLNYAVVTVRRKTQLRLASRVRRNRRMRYFYDPFGRRIARQVDRGQTISGW